jgi:hypothetical protein
MSRLSLPATVAFPELVVVPVAAPAELDPSNGDAATLVNAWTLILQALFELDVTVHVVEVVIEAVVIDHASSTPDDDCTNATVRV